MNYTVLYCTVLCEFINYRGTSLVSRLQQSSTVPHSEHILCELPDGAGHITHTAWPSRNAHTSGVNQHFSLMHCWLFCAFSGHTSRASLSVFMVAVKHLPPTLLAPSECRLLRPPPMKFIASAFYLLQLLNHSLPDCLQAISSFLFPLYPPSLSLPVQLSLASSLPFALASCIRLSSSLFPGSFSPHPRPCLRLVSQT